jgi:DNA-binding HxlR family transcriptional regulator
MTDLGKIIQRKGTIEGIIALSKEGQKSQSELMRDMQVANGTVQKRLRDLQSLGLVTQDAELSPEGNPRKVYRLTDKGSEKADTLQELLRERDE